MENFLNRLSMLTVEAFYQKYEEKLKLKAFALKNGLQRQIENAKYHRAGLFLTGFTQYYKADRILIFGYQESQYLRTLNSQERYQRLAPLLTEQTPFLMVSKSFLPIDELEDLSQQRDLAIIQIPETTARATHQLSSVLSEEFAPTTMRHGTFIEVYDVGVLLEGDSSVGKSETALGLIEKGHRLVADDVVCIRRHKENLLEGCGVELTRHHMEIRGIGIINIATIYGAYSVRNKKNIDMIIKLEAWSDHQYYDRLGLEENFYNVLDVQVPHSILPVKPGRDVVLLIETMALHHRLRLMGHHPAKEFQLKQQALISANSKLMVE